MVVHMLNSKGWCCDVLNHLLSSSGKHTHLQSSFRQSLFNMWVFAIGEVHCIWIDTETIFHFQRESASAGGFPGDAWRSAITTPPPSTAPPIRKPTNAVVHSRMALSLRVLQISLRTYSGQHTFWYWLEFVKTKHKTLLSIIHVSWRRVWIATKL